MSTEAVNEMVAVDNSTAPVVSNQTSQFDLVDVKGAAAYMNNYQEAIKALLTPEDYQTIANKDFKKKSAWRKLATAFRISDEVIDECIEYDETSQILRAKYRVKCTLPNGRSAEGVGVCSIFDKIRYKDTAKFNKDKETPSNFELRSRFSNAEHDVLGTAHSRAKNRAISDLIGAGEVSAEEMSNNHGSTKPKNNPTPKPQTTGQTATMGNKSKAPKKSAPKVKAPEKQKYNDAIEVEATEVHDLSGDKPGRPLKELIDENSFIKLAVDELQSNGETVNRDRIKDKLLDLMEYGKLSEDDYLKAKELLE